MHATPVPTASLRSCGRARSRPMHRCACSWGPKVTARAGPRRDSGRCTRLALRPIELLLDVKFGIATVHQLALHVEDHLRIAADVDHRLIGPQAEIAADRA